MTQPLIIGLGEILWDVFPDGPRFGGAPCNFACSVAELASGSARVCMVSAVGQDNLGQEALGSLIRHGVDTSYVQINSHDTGMVHVQLDEAGVASYRFADESAWDHLAWSTDLEQLARECNVVCFGTLGQRGGRSRETIRRFVQSTGPEAIRLLDINLRAPYDDETIMLESLELANVLKLNEDELPRVAHLLKLSGTPTDVLTKILLRYGLKCVALTRGASGAVLAADCMTSEMPGVAVTVLDTVGAGDAYTAALVLGLLNGRPLDAINRHAVQVAGYACTQSGGTMRFPEELRAVL